MADFAGFAQDLDECECGRRDQFGATDADPDPSCHAGQAVRLSIFLIGLIVAMWPGGWQLLVRDVAGSCRLIRGARPTHARDPSRKIPGGAEMASHQGRAVNRRSLSGR